MNTTIRLSYDRAVKKGTENDPNPEILPAARGHFSEPFFRRTRFALELAPGLVQHIASLRDAAGGGAERVQTTKEMPLPFNAQAWDDANEVYKNLVYWSVVFAGMLRLSPPSPARRSWRASDDRVIGLPANISPTDSRYVVGIIGLWLRTQLEPIMHLRADEVMEFHEQLGDVFRLSARWPQRDRATWSKLPCPWCGGRLAVYPPEVLGAERMAVCEGCTRSLTQEEFDANVDRVATATKEAQKLVIKHGRNIPGEWRL